VETLLCEFTFLATSLPPRKQRDQVLTIAPSPVHGPEHRHSLELAPGLGDGAAVWLGPARKGWSSLLSCLSKLACPLREEEEEGEGENIPSSM